MKRRIAALLLGGAMVGALGVPGLAADAGLPDTPVMQEEQKIPASVLYYGQVTEVVRDENGAVVRLIMESEAHGDYIMNVTADTCWVDSGNRMLADPADLKEGEQLYVFRSPMSTRSIPPQSAALAVVRNLPQDARCAMYHVVEAVSVGENGTLSITTDNGGLILYINQNTQLVSGSSDGAAPEAGLSAFPVGTRIMAWYDMVLESYPGQAYPSHVMVLPGQAEEEYQSPAEGAQLTMELDGKVPNMVGRYEKDTPMVPVAAVAQVLGFEVTYTPDTEQGTLVTVESESFAVSLYIDQGLVYGATKIKGASGMTGPQSYGRAAYIAAPGTTWASAEIFQMLGKTVTLEGTNLIIR